MKVVLPMGYFTAGPGSEIWISGTARLVKAFRQISPPVANLMIYRVCKAAITLVVVLRAAIILPAFSLASIQVHSFNP